MVKKMVLFGSLFTFLYALSIVAQLILSVKFEGAVSYAMGWTLFIFYIADKEKE